MSVYEEHGLRCPSCNNDEFLDVEVSIMVRLTEEGTRFLGCNHEWHDGSKIRCNGCGWFGAVQEAKGADHDENVLAYFVEVFNEAGARVMVTSVPKENFNEEEYEGLPSVKITRLVDANSI